MAKAKNAKSPKGNTLFPGRISASNNEIGTSNREVDIIVG